MKIESYAVTCDGCQGRMFDENGLLCQKCHGDGQVLINELDRERVKHAIDTWLANARALRATVARLVKP